MAKRKRNKKNKQEQKQSFFSKILSATGITTSVDIVSKFVAIILVLALVLTIFSGVACVILAVMQVVQGVIDSLTGLNPDGLNIGSTTQAKPGAQYVWNVQDLEKMPDEWSKNLYRLAWLADENKKAQDSDMPMNLLMGIPVLETGSMFYPQYSVPADIVSKYMADNNVNEETARKELKSLWNTYSIAEYATVGGGYPEIESSAYIAGIYACDAQIVQDENIASKATWGTLPHSALDTATLGNKHVNYIQTYANGDVEKSVYSPAVSVATTIHLYENSLNKVFEQDADYGYAHQYKKYWETACAKYGLDATDSTTRNNVYAMVYYLVHAGGVWQYEDIADDFYYMMFDYIVFVYKNVAGCDLNNISLLDSYVASDVLRRIDCNVLKAAARGDDNTGHHNATMWNTPTIERAYLQYKTEEGYVPLEQSLVELWMQFNTECGATDMVENYKTIYLHENKSLVRQGEYAFSTGTVAIFAGNARLDYIFDTLNIDYVVNQKTGYVCYTVKGSIGAGNFTSGTFDTENSRKPGYSNYRDATWFATLDDSEWTDPLNPDINGGFKVTSRYGYRYLSENNPWDWHSGMDFAYWQTSSDLTVLRSSYPVYAMHDGVITYINTSTANTGGRYLHYKVTYMRNGEEVTRYLTYMHLSGFTEEIEAEISKQLTSYRGSVSIPVKRGEPIAYMGGSGSGNGAANEFGYAVHLHVSLSKNPSVSGPAGRLDMETELPFVTMYDNYDAWFESGTSGYLKQKPASDITETGIDPQAP